MRAPIDTFLRRTLIVVVIADLILFLNFSRPESLTSMSYDPFTTVWQLWLLVAAATIGIVLVVRAWRRRRETPNL